MTTAAVPSRLKAKAAYTWTTYQLSNPQVLSTFPAFGNYDAILMALILAEGFTYISILQHYCLRM